MRRSLSLVAGVTLLLAACGDATPVRETPAESEPEPFFARSRSERGVGLEAGYRGPLVVRDRCVLIGDGSQYSVPIWPKVFAGSYDPSGRFVVRDGEGVVVAVEGRVFEMGGGYSVEFWPKNRVEPQEVQLRRLERTLGYSIPERCLGPDVYGVWWVGET